MKKDNYLYLILIKKKLNKLLTMCIKVFINNFYLCGKRNKHVIQMLINSKLSRKKLNIVVICL